MANIYKVTLRKGAFDRDTFLIESETIGQALAKAENVVDIAPKKYEGWMIVSVSVEYGRVIK